MNPNELCLWYSFLYLKIVKIHLYRVPLWSIMVSEIPEFWNWKFWDRIMSRSIQETHALRNVKNQVLLFLSSWEPNLSDLMIYDLFGQNFLFCICIYKCSKLLKKVGTFLQTIYKFQLFFIPAGRTYTAKYLLLVLSLSTWRSVNGS